MQNERTLIIACETVIEEMLPIMPAGLRYQTLEFGLHIHPDKLRSTLQQAIDSAPEDVDTILLGYGLCSQAAIGIQARRYTLVIPKVDDCISIFLGTHAAYKAQCAIEPGSYYLTKGWIQVGSSPVAEIDEMIQKYGAEKAERLQKLMLRNYKRIAFINTGQYEVERYREYSRDMADRMGMRYEEIAGSNEMVKRLMEGQWNEEFLVLQPGDTIRYNQFFPG